MAEDLEGVKVPNVACILQIKQHPQNHTHNHYVQE